MRGGVMTPEAVIDAFHVKFARGSGTRSELPRRVRSMRIVGADTTADTVVVRFRAPLRTHTWTWPIDREQPWKEAIVFAFMDDACSGRFPHDVRSWLARKLHRTDWPS